MDLNTNIDQKNISYWSQRSAGYSDVNKEELSGISRSLWQNALHSRITEHFPDRLSSEISILDIGTGPGFFAIILAEMGYRVTAVDMTPEMLDEARINAGHYIDVIDFRQMNAEELDFRDNTFDVIVSRNLTWNLPHPKTAYSEWHRVLRAGGLILNFDSNWYRYLFDEDALRAYETDRTSSRELGLGDQNVGENFDVMEDIARCMPLSPCSRPHWDLNVLKDLGLEASADEHIWRRVWTRQEQTNFASTPMFMISAIKQLSACQQ